ncbi:MAG: HDIG domain-containing protein [Bacteroidales bacterium]|nr:HDIG domain-containing protein [Bacteroidales bacterium]
MTPNQLIDQYYPAGTKRRDIYLKHCRQVAGKALAIMRQKSLDLDPREVEEAAMLHDIGIFLTDAPGIDCHGQEHYLRHGLLGAKLLRDNHFPEIYASVAERHTGAGLTADEAAALGLPQVDLCPHSLLERLICYADKFYSKSGTMEEKPLERVRASMARFSPSTLDRFESLHREFS